MRITNLISKQTARVGAFFAAMALVLGFAPTANAAAGNNNLKIIAWYGAGNLASTEYARDTVILFNPTQAAITMDGWTLQTGSNNGAFTNVNTTFKLPTVTIPAGGYYAITGSGVNYISGTGCNTTHCNLNYPFDYQINTIEGKATDSDNIFSSGAVTVALVNNTVPLGTCDLTSSHLVDIVGVAAADSSSNTTCYAGGGNAPLKAANVNGIATTYHGTSLAYATIRRNRCIDTFNNSEDFTLGYIDYKNSATTPEPCPVGAQTAVNEVVATPNNPIRGGTFMLTAKPTAADGNTLTSVIADLSNIGGSATTAMYDDGTHGDAVAGDGTYTVGPINVPSTQAVNMVLGMSVTATDSTGNKAIAPISFAVSSTTVYSNSPGPGNNNIRMLAWYGAGNLAISEYARDTVILFNPTNHNITASNWSLQNGGAAGAFSAVTYKLFATPQLFVPGAYFAITGSGPAYISGVGCVSDHCNLNYPFDYQLTTIEGNATTNQNSLSSTQVVEALVDNQTAVGTGCPKYSAHVIDMVGIGAVTGSVPVNCYDGTGYAPYVPASWPGSATTDPVTSIHGIRYAYATVRTNKCVNTFDNSKDWILGYIDYKNSASTPEPCNASTTVNSLDSQLRVVATATPSKAYTLDPVLFTAKVTPSAGATATSVVVDLSNLGGATGTAMYDDGTHGDVTAGDGTYSLSYAPTSAPYFGQATAINVTATDTAGQVGNFSVPFNLDGGEIDLVAAQTSATIKAGEVAYFDIDVKSVHGYFGTAVFSCTGTPHGVGKDAPSKTNCVLTPPLVTLTSNATGKTRLAISAGTTVLSGFTSRSVPMALIAILSMMLLAVAIWRRKHLPVAGLLAVICFLSLQSTGCETNAGLGNTNAEPGTYTYVVHVADSNSVSIQNDLTFTLTVQ